MSTGHVAVLTPTNVRATFASVRQNASCRLWYAGVVTVKATQQWGRAMATPNRQWHSDREHFWLKLIRRQQRCGQSFRAFCAEHGVSESPFSPGARIWTGLRGPTGYHAGWGRCLGKAASSSCFPWRSVCASRSTVPGTGARSAGTDRSAVRRGAAGEEPACRRPLGLPPAVAENCLLLTACRDAPDGDCARGC